LAVKWFSQGYDLLFLCGYPMAEQEFAKQVQSKYRNVQFYTKEHVEGFKKAISFPLSSKTVVFVKNIELFHDEVFQVVSGIENLVLSGNLNQAHSTWITNEKFTTSIYFSPFQNEDLSMIKKYEGLVVSGDYRGVTRLES
jgi:hypothetical protein